MVGYIIIHHLIFGKTYGELTDEERSQANGWLDYSQWTPPPLKEKI